MLQALRRHPLAMRTTFGHSLMLMYAFEPALLRPMLPPGVELDTYQAPDGGEYGFVAVGVVSAQHLRPTVLPAGWGGDFLLTGYRIVARFSRTRPVGPCAGSTFCAATRIGGRCRSAATC